MFCSVIMASVSSPASAQKEVMQPVLKQDNSVETHEKTTRMGLDHDFPGCPTSPCILRILSALVGGLKIMFKYMSIF